MFKVMLDDPNLGSLEKKYILEAIDSSFVSTIGPFVNEFEEKFASYIGSKKAVSTQSGTAALHIILYELGIGQGDEVIVPSFTFIASINPILYVGATPVIVDMDSVTWNIDPEEIKKAISKKTKAIIPVHVYGSVSNIEEIINIAREHGIYVIEDATESLGATYKNKQTGSFGDFGFFSFNGNKLITTGGGGMIVSDNVERIDHIKFIINQARDSSRGYYHPELGFNYRMTNIEAALGLAQLERIGSFLEKKNTFRSIYQNVFRDLPFIKFQQADENAIGSWWLTAILIDMENIIIDDIQIMLKKKGVPTRKVFMLASEMPYLKSYSRPCPNAYEVFKKGMCLPSSTQNTEENIKEAASIIKEVLNG